MKVELKAMRGKSLWEPGIGAVNARAENPQEARVLQLANSLISNKTGALHALVFAVGKGLLPKKQLETITKLTDGIWEEFADWINDGKEPKE